MIIKSGRIILQNAVIAYKDVFGDVYESDGVTAVRVKVSQDGSELLLTKSEWEEVNQNENSSRNIVEIDHDLAQSLDFFMVLRSWKRDDLIKAIVEGRPSPNEGETKHILNIVRHMNRGRAIVFNAIYYGYKVKHQTLEDKIEEILRKHDDAESYTPIVNEIMELFGGNEKDALPGEAERPE